MSVNELRNDKYMMMKYTSWINSTPSQQQSFELFSSMAGALGLQPRGCEFGSHYRHEAVFWQIIIPSLQ